MTRINRRQALGGALASLAACRVQTVRAQARYPDRSIRVIVPFAAGGVGDSVMRVLAPRMEQKLGQKLIIESKPGGAGNLGAREVARAEPDGYTILVAACGNFVINQFLTKIAVRSAGRIDADREGRGSTDRLLCEFLASRSQPRRIHHACASKSRKIELRLPGQSDRSIIFSSSA